MTQSSDAELSRADLLKLTAEIATAYVGQNPISTTELPSVINAIYASLAGMDAPAASVGALTPAVAVKKSITRSYIICLEDGRKFKTLKRHLRTAFGMTPDEYRARWGLPADYPMVAPEYAERRSELALEL